MSMKPTNVDAQRILAILQELKERLGVMSVITPQVLEVVQANEDWEVVELMGWELLKKFAEQIHLEELYVIAGTGADGSWAWGGGGGAELSEGKEAELKDTLERLSRNTLDVCRRFRGWPGALAELRNMQENRPQQVMNMIRTLSEVEELTLKRLTTTVEEERSRKELLEHYMAREEAATKKREQLEKDLVHVRREREKAQTSRSEVVTKLKADLLDVKDSTEMRLRNLREKYEGRMKELQDRFNKKEEDYVKQIQTLKDQNKTLIASTRETEVGLRRKKVRGEVDIETVVKQYDEMMESVVADYDAQYIEFEKEKRQLGELEEHFKRVDEELYRQAKEEELTQLREKMVGDEKKRMADAAKQVQAFWKGLLQREDYQRQKRGKKGGKKGKKK